MAFKNYFQQLRIVIKKVITEITQVVCNKIKDIYSKTEKTIEQQCLH